MKRHPSLHPLSQHHHFALIQALGMRRAAEAEEGKRDWAVYGRFDQGTQEPEEDFRQKWSAFGIPGEQVRFGSHILILRFDNSTMGTQRSPTSVQTGAGRRHYPRLSFYTPNP